MTHWGHLTSVDLGEEFIDIDGVRRVELVEVWRLEMRRGRASCRSLAGLG